MNTTKHRRGRGIILRTAASLALLQPLMAAAAPALPPKSVTTSANLNFGRFVAAGGGTVIMTPNGTRTRGGAVVLLASSVSPARFTIQGGGAGNDNRTYILTLPPNGSVALASGVNRMPVIDFKTSGTGSGLLGGTQIFSVGATLQVSPNQPRGSYSGQFPVTVEYQ